MTLSSADLSFWYINTPRLSGMSQEHHERSDVVCLCCQPSWNLSHTNILDTSLGPQALADRKTPTTSGCICHFFLWETEVYSSPNPLCTDLSGTGQYFRDVLWSRKYWRVPDWQGLCVHTALQRFFESPFHCWTIDRSCTSGGHLLVGMRYQGTSSRILQKRFIRSKGREKKFQFSSIKLLFIHPQFNATKLKCSLFQFQFSRPFKPVIGTPPDILMRRPRDWCI